MKFYTCFINDIYNKTNIEEIIKYNLKDYYCSKLRHLLKTSHQAKKINMHHYSSIEIEIKNRVSEHGKLSVSEHVYLFML